MSAGPRGAIRDASPLRHGAVLPNFLLIGAAKSGTTALWSTLAQHPDVFLSATKEPNYFAFLDGPPSCAGPAPQRVVHELLHRFCVLDWDAYLDLFSGVTGESAVGEASVRYLYMPQAAQRVHERLPDVRLVAVLREPVARLYSHYWMNRQFHLEPLALEDAIAAEPERRARGWGYDWHYVAVGRYAEQLERWFRLFGRERVAVFLHDDLKRDPLAVFRAVCRFLHVDERFVPDVSARPKAAYRPRFAALDRVLQHPGPVRALALRTLRPARFQRAYQRVRAWNASVVPVLEGERRVRLGALFDDEVTRLERLLGRDLEAWRASWR